jgi:hypothetical protein
MMARKKAIIVTEIPSGTCKIFCVNGHCRLQTVTTGGFHGHTRKIAQLGVCKVIGSGVELEVNRLALRNIIYNSGLGG